MRRGNILLVVLVVVGIAAASIGGYFWWTAQKPKDEPPPVGELKPKEASPSAEETAGWKINKDKRLGIEIKTPGDWVQYGKTYPLEGPEADITLTSPDGFERVAISSWSNPTSLEIFCTGTMVVKTNLHDLVFCENSSVDYVSWSTIVWNPSNIQELPIKLTASLEKKNSSQTVIRRILSTLKFL